MAKPKENRRIPDLVISKLDDQAPFESLRTLETENYTCFGVTKQEVRALSLKVIFGDGKMALIQYSRMLSPITYNGKNEIKINTPVLNMAIQGSNLAPLLDYLGEQRLAWIQSSTADSLSDSLMMRKGEPEIFAIQMHPAKKVEEKKGE
ncbi:MAG: hypothetical protein R2824_24085 [Saprospiraceae bacterium]